MRNYYRIHRILIFIILLVLNLITSCTENNKPKAEKSGSDSIQVVIPKNRQPNADPSFERTKDTISLNGPHSITRSVLQDRNGNIWLASWEGIIRYDGKLFTNITLKEGLPQFHVFSILEDRSGNLWFGTIGGGVIRFDGRNYTNFTSHDNLVGNSVICIQEDKAGNIWLGTTEGVSCYSGNNFRNFTTQNGLSSNFISSIEEDKNGKLWFGTNGGINCYDPLHSSISGGPSFVNFSRSKDLSFHNVRAILEDREGHIWICSQEGLNRFDGKSLTTIPTYFPMNIFEDRAGNLWLSGGKENGKDMTLYKYDGKIFSEIKTSLQIFGVTEDRDGNIWFGTASGVCRYDGKSQPGQNSAFAYFKDSLN